MELLTETLMDCTGRVTHKLYLAIDGTVEVVDAHGARARIDPIRQVCLTPGAHITPPVMDLAVAMARMHL